MQRTRTIAALVASVSVAALTLAGCTSTGGGGADDAKTLTIAYWNYGPAAETGNQAIADGFTADHPDVTIDLLPIAGDNWGGYYANLATTIGSGEKPDLAFTASEGIKFLAQNGLVVPINDYLDSDPEAAAIKDDIAPELLDSFAFNGEITALPNGWNNMIIYYNTAVFEAAGVPFPTEDWTWDDFKATAAALTKDTDGDGVPNTYGFTWASNEIFRASCPGSRTPAATW
jgi:multiple sugar transport system substrate-binding protein